MDSIILVYYKLRLLVASPSSADRSNTTFSATYCLGPLGTYAEPLWLMRHNVPSSLPLRRHAITTSIQSRREQRQQRGGERGEERSRLILPKLGKSKLFLGTLRRTSFAVEEAGGGGEGRFFLSLSLPPLLSSHSLSFAPQSQSS